MLYMLSKLFDIITSPSTALLLISATGLMLTLGRSRSRWTRRLLFIGIGGLVAFAVLPLGSWMIRPLETRFPTPNPMPRHVDGIIVLGGAIRVDTSIDWKRPVLNEAAQRMTTFVALARRYPKARLVFTGGNADPLHAKPAEAVFARRFFDEMGLRSRGIVYESKSRNTRENALYSRRLVRPRRGQTWLLITTAADLPRAVGCFREVGWSVVPVPTDFRGARDGGGWLPGLTGGLRNANWAMHEWIGLVYYRLRGWTPSLFPGPV